MSTDKKLLLDTVKEYSGHTTIHGLNYIFASFLTFNDRIFWLVIFLFGFIFSVYLSIDAFVDWRKNMIITRFENSELPVTEIAFPAVTICNQGLNMDYVAMAVERDFYEWHKAHAGEEGRDTLGEMMAVYLKEKFDINKGDPSILEIIQSTTSTGGASAMVAEALTKNAKKCSEKQAKESVQGGEGKSTGVGGGEPPEKLEGSECPLMRGFSLQGDEVEEGVKVPLEQEEEEVLQDGEDKYDDMRNKSMNEVETKSYPGNATSRKGDGAVKEEKEMEPSVIVLEGVSLAECSHKCYSHPTCRGFSFRCKNSSAGQKHHSHPDRNHPQRGVVSVSPALPLLPLPAKQ